MKAKKNKQWYPPEKYYPEIEKVIYNKPVTIVILKTKEKGIAKLGNGDKWSPELGFWVAYAKALRKKCSPLGKAISIASMVIDKALDSYKSKVKINENIPIDTSKGEYVIPRGLLEKWQTNGIVTK